MTSTEARNAIKSRLSIPSAITTYDTLIDGFVVSAVSRLFPRASYEVDVQTVSSPTIDTYGESQINLSTLSTPIRSARQVEAYSDGYWQKITDTYHHGIYLRLRDVPTSTTSIRIYGLTYFADITKVYDWLTQFIIWIGMSDFYDSMASNAADYTSYQQQTGARAVDNLSDQSTLYETKADRFLDEQSQNYGA
jgi:hypothetical protein